MLLQAPMKVGTILWPVAKTMRASSIILAQVLGPFRHWPQHPSPAKMSVNALEPHLVIIARLIENFA